MTNMQSPAIPKCTYRRFATRETPLALFEALYAPAAIAFLYESLESDGARGRYSFVGGSPWWTLAVRGGEIEFSHDAMVERIFAPPLDVLRSLLRVVPDIPPVAPFCGGAVGYLGYDCVRWIERIPASQPADPLIPDAFFLFPREIVCFDHVDKIAHVLVFDDSCGEERLKRIENALADAGGARKAAGPASTISNVALPELRANQTREEFCERVRRAQQYIQAGDAFQVVLSQRFDFEVSVPPLDLYRALRLTNPSPYMYYLRLDGIDIVGSSPEMLVRSHGRRVCTRPLAGTRRRGSNAAEDARLEAELRADPKENAEHAMLIDLGRNDLGRICEFGSVETRKILSIERHSRVMHLVSDVEGWLRAECDALDVFAATFPAGTVSGAPKVRAMEIIDELEPTRRGVYAGAIGYFSLAGDVDLCIAIRSIVVQGQRGMIQAGAGVVADSIPANEYEETLNKARALFDAVQKASEPFVAS